MISFIYRIDIYDKALDLISISTKRIGEQKKRKLKDKDFIFQTVEEPFPGKYAEVILKSKGIVIVKNKVVSGRKAFMMKIEVLVKNKEDELKVELKDYSFEKFPNS